jgi:hypothetical protein
MDILNTIQKIIENDSNPVILLEGKRNVLDNDKDKLIKIGKRLAEKFPSVIFRSGNADGSDNLFIQGVASVPNSKIELVVPYQGHKKQNIPETAKVINLNELDFECDTQFVMLTKNLLSKRSADAIDKYILNNKITTQSTTKAAYLLRDTIKVTGYNDVNKACLGLFYDDLKNPESGGTGYTMLTCRTLKIPYFKQDVYFELLK